MTDQRRVQGIRFGDLAERLREHDYPTGTEQLLEAHGDQRLELPGGTETLRTALSPRSPETFDSPAEVREAVVGTVGGDAVGRRKYTDRDPPADREGGVGRDKSF